MFVARQIELAARRERLVAQAESQRVKIAAAVHSWEKPAAIADRGIAAARFLKAHPLLLAGVVAGVAVLGRRSLVRWAGRGFIAWRTWQSVGGWVRGIRI